MPGQRRQVRQHRREQPAAGEHGDLHVRSKNAWLVEAAGKRVFFGADSSNPDIRLYENMGSLMRELDVFCIGMECVGAPYPWLYSGNSKQVQETRKMVELCAGIGIGAESLARSRSGSLSCRKRRTRSPGSAAPSRSARISSLLRSLLFRGAVKRLDTPRNR
jgi:hypothetical protein